MTDDVVAGLTVDYDLANASVRALTMRPVGRNALDQTPIRFARCHVPKDL